MKAGKVEREARRVLQTRVRPLPGEKGENIFHVGIVWEELAKPSIVRPKRAHSHSEEEQAKPSIGTGGQRRDMAAGGYQSGTLVIGPNCSIAGAAAFSSGQLFKLNTLNIRN